MPPHAPAYPRQLHPKRYPQLVQQDPTLYYPAANKRKTVSWDDVPCLRMGSRCPQDGLVPAAGTSPVALPHWGAGLEPHHAVWLPAGPFPGTDAVLSILLPCHQHQSLTCSELCPPICRSISLPGCSFLSPCASPAAVCCKIRGFWGEVAHLPVPASPLVPGRYRHPSKLSLSSPTKVEKAVIKTAEHTFLPKLPHLFRESDAAVFHGFLQGWDLVGCKAINRNQSFPFFSSRLKGEEFKQGPL